MITSKQQREIFMSKTSKEYAKAYRERQRSLFGRKGRVFYTTDEEKTLLDSVLSCVREEPAKFSRIEKITDSKK